MKFTLPIVNLVFVSLLADGICWPLARGVSFPAPALIVGYALAFSQVGLLTIWAGLASTAWPTCSREQAPNARITN
jgi:hypothetical protein